MASDGDESPVPQGHCLVRQVWGKHRRLMMMAPEKVRPEDSEMDCHRVLISNGLDRFVLLLVRLARPVANFVLLPLCAAGSEAFLFLPFSPTPFSQCCLSFLFSSFFPPQSLLSPPFVSPALYSAGHSMLLSRALSRKRSHSLLRSCPSARQPYHSRSPSQIQNGIQRRAQESPSPSYHIQQGRPL